MKQALLFTGKKLLRAALLLLGVSLAAFLLLCASPLDPLQTNVGQVALGSMSPEQVANLEAYWGVDQPPAQRYLGWLSSVLHGDFGTSLLYRQPVLSVIGQRLGSSLWLLLTAWVLSGVLGLVLGLVAGAFRGRWPDKLIRGYCLVISSTPAFWLALLLLLVFSVWLGWLPIGLSVPIGVEESAVTWLDRLRHAILPTLTLSVTGVANIALHTREKLVDVLSSDYVFLARARGESRRSLVLRHGLRNVALPALTLQFGSISEIIGGSVLVEQVFSYPGLGQAAVTAGLGSDLPLLLGITVITSALVFGGNLAADLLYGLVDPRIRKGVGEAMKPRNRRLTTLWFVGGAALFLLAVTVAGLLLEERAMETDFSRQNLAPSLAAPFGTDWMGRDMLARTLAGLSLSIRIGLLTAAVSAGVALALGILSAVFGGWVDAFISWWIDLVMGIPHILLVILLSIACGRGFTGVVVGVALSHWTSLARVIRGEVLQLKSAPYLLVAEKLGVSPWKRVRLHLLPHLLPQFLTGLILLFPHAILHEASVTFLGFGLSSEQPAIGVILSESMRYLTTGKWWLALFPGAALVLVVVLFALLGERVRLLADPASAHE